MDQKQFHYASSSAPSAANPIPGALYPPTPAFSATPAVPQYYVNPSPPVPFLNPISVIGPQYCSPNPVDLAITRKFLTITDGNFVITDINGNFMFKVKDPLFHLHDRRIIIDSTGKTILTLRQKIMTAHNRWEVFRGEGSEPSNLIFTAKTSKVIQLKTELDVFLANNKAQLASDFKVKGSWTERSCIVYAGESTSIMAQMHKKITPESVLLGKNKFMVTVYPNIDFAFIAALIVILDDTNTDHNLL